GVLLFGAPPTHGIDTCDLATLACVLMYGGSKGLIYLCLIERAHAVWGNGRRRLKSPVYVICMALLLPLLGITAVMLAQGIRFLHNGYCIIGMSRLSSILIMSYDTFNNSLLTILFIAPLVRSSIRSARLRTIAIRAAIASFVGLLIEIINGFILFATGGKEMIWVCLGACAADIVANAVLLYWAMDGPSSANRSHSVHFSTIRQTALPSSEVSESTRNTSEAGVGQNNPVILTALRDHASRTPRQDDVFSEDMTFMSSECVLTLENPKSVFRGSSKALCIDRQLRRAETHPCSTCGVDQSGKIPTGGSLEDDPNNTSIRPSRVRRWSA
ncbi:unnamed protein product, partial [Rhizoctonia solani]